MVSAPYRTGAKPQKARAARVDLESAMWRSGSSPRHITRCTSIPPLAGVEGLEPPTPGFGDRCSDQLSYTPSGGTGPGGLIMRSRRPGPQRMRRITHRYPKHNRLARRFARGDENYQSRTAATTPAPTVRPPSRMAKRSFSSMAIGTISSTSIATLSPGITISVPSGNCTMPVTSVVRK